MKLFFAAAAVFAALSLCADDELKINGDFKGSVLNAIQPKGWVKNHAASAGIGVSSVVAGEKDGEFAVNVKTQKTATSFYTQSAYAAKPGDTLKMEADFKGTGKIMFSYYAYDAQARYISTKNGKVQVLAAPGEMKDVIIVDKVAGKEVASVRVVVSVLANSDITFSDVEAEIVKP